MRNQYLSAICLSKLIWCLSALLVFQTLPLFCEPSPQYEFYGKHMLAQFYECDQEALNNTKRLSQVMREATFASGAHLLDSVEHTFTPSGFSMILLLSESHGSIHTYPDQGACFVDFFTCGHHCSPPQFIEILEKYLRPKRTEKQLIERK